MNPKKGVSFHRGSVKEQASRKLSGRQCTYVWNISDGRQRRCQNKTGRNFFFCKEHHGVVSDYGMVTGGAL